MQLSCGCTACVYEGFVNNGCFTHRWEAHIWVKDLGRQVYLGGYEHEEHAAEAFDVAALKCKGMNVQTNFDINRWAWCCQHVSSQASAGLEDNAAVIVHV